MNLNEIKYVNLNDSPTTGVHFWFNENTTFSGITRLSNLSDMWIKMEIRLTESNQIPFNPNKHH